MSLFRRSARPERNGFSVHETGASNSTIKLLGRIACIVGFALLFFGVGQAQADIINFKAGGPGPTCNNSYRSQNFGFPPDDFRFAQPSGFIIGNGQFTGVPAPGGDASECFLVTDATTEMDVLTMSRSDGNAFDLLSAGVGPVFALGHTQQATEISVIGCGFDTNNTLPASPPCVDALGRKSTSVFQQLITVPSDEFTRFSFGGGFTNLSRVEFTNFQTSTGDFALHNIEVGPATVGVVPEPDSLTLLAIAMLVGAGIFWRIGKTGIIL